MRFDVGKGVNYLNFGFLPVGHFRTDVLGRLIGARNLLKRLQAADVMDALAVQPTDVVLDLGCGSGYMTVEIAKNARKAIGVDVIDYVETIKIPASLAGRLEYRRSSGERLPFPDGSFDCALASEVLPMTADPGSFLRELKRVLKPSGRLVICNGAGHPAIREAYEQDSSRLRRLRLKYPDRMPASYAQYCEILQSSFQTAQKTFFEPPVLHAMLAANGYTIERTFHSPGYRAGAYISWSQFIMYLQQGRTLSQAFFLPKFYFFSLIRLFERRSYPGGVICVARPA